MVGAIKDLFIMLILTYLDIFNRRQENDEESAATVFAAGAA